MLDRMSKVVMVVMLSGCALTMQEHLPAEYAYETEPRCSTNMGWVTLDGLDLAADLASAIIALVPPNGSEGSPEVSATATLGAVIDAGSMIAGIKWGRECDRARAEYDRRQRERREEDVRSALELQHREPAVAAPRGFFCASSPSVATASLCARERTDCERARDAALAGVGDLDECVLVELAWCFAPGRCAASEAACQAQQEAGGAVAAPCREQR